MFPVDVQGEESLDDRRGALERLQRLEQRYDVEPAHPLVRPEQPRLAGQEQHFQHVGRLGRPAGDIRVQRFLGRLPLQDGGDGAERLDDLVRLGGIVEVGRYERPRRGQLAGEQVEAFVGGQRARTILADPRAAEDLGERRAVAGAVLSEVEREQVDAEDFDEANHVPQGPVGCVVRAGTAEVVLHDPKVVDQRVAADVDPGGRGLRRVGPGRGDRADEGQRPPELLGDHLALHPIRLVLARRFDAEQRDVLLDRLAQLRARGAEPLGVAESPPQVIDPGEVVLEEALLLEPDRLDRGDGRDARMAVAVAADPRAEAEERRHAPIAAGISPTQGGLEVTIETGDDVE